VIDLPFDNSQMSMIFVLPIGDGAGAVRSTDLIGILDALESTRVALSLPKFKFESTYDNIKSALSQLGIVAPFTAGSGALCGMFENIADCENLVIDDVIQKTVIDVNEKGVEAAAVTAVMVSVTSAGPEEPPPPDPILMILDHPFQFFIYDKEQELMLFEGRLGSPEVPETEPESPLLDAQHTDADFWSNSFGVNPIDPTANMSSTSNTTATVVGDLSSQETSSPTPKPSYLPTIEATPNTTTNHTPDSPTPTSASISQEGTMMASPVPTSSPSPPQATGSSAPKARLVISFVSMVGVLAALLYLS